MDFIREYGKELFSLTVPLVTWVLNVGLKAKVKLQWTSPHAFTFLIEEPLKDAAGNVVRPKQLAATASIRVLNSGRETATKVELVFNYPPQFMNVWPARSYESKTAIDNRYTVIFDSLTPKETVGLEILAVNNDLPHLLLVRSEQVVAKRVEQTWIPLVPAWKIAMARLLMFLGLATFVYGCVAILQFLFTQTPPVLK